MTQDPEGAAADPPEASQAAVAAAGAAGVVIRELRRHEERKAARRLFEDVWRPEVGDPPPMTAELLRALGHAGNYVVGAFAGGVRGTPEGCPGGSGRPRPPDPRAGPGIRSRSAGGAPR